jgi:hypothetical protein
VGQRRVIHDKIKRLKYKLLVFEWCRAPVSLVFRSDRYGGKFKAANDGAEDFFCAGFS